MDAKNKILLDFKDNAAMREALGQKKPGEKCRMEIEFQVDSLTEEGLQGHILKIAPEGYEEKQEATEPAEASEEIEPSVDEPVMVVMGRKKKS